MIDRASFAAVLTAPDGLALTAGQAAGCDPLLDEWERRPALTDLRWPAYMLASVHKETGGTMQPIEDAGQGRTCDIPLDDGGQRVRPEEQIERGLRGKPAVPTFLYHGRGYLPRNLCHIQNYRRACEIVVDGKGVDFLHQPERALEPRIAAALVVDGMVQGLFTGFPLKRFFRADGFEDWYDARRVIDGHDDADAVAAVAKAFHVALLTSSP